MKLEISDFPDELIQQLADKLGARLKQPERTKPYSLTEAAATLGIAKESIRLAVHAGEIPRVPGISVIRIPASVIHGMLDGTFALPTQKRGGRK